LGIAMFHRERQLPLQGLPGCGRECFGGTIPATIWKAAATAMLAEVPPEPFPEPGEDDRKYPSRRRLGPRMGSPVPRPSPTPTTESPTPTPEPTETETGGFTEQPIVPAVPPV
jgi:hypothetical protein